jgi:hypothetical protein
MFGGDGGTRTLEASPAVFKFSPQPTTQGVGVHIVLVHVVEVDVVRVHVQPEKSGSLRSAAWPMRPSLRSGLPGLDQVGIGSLL